MSNVYVWDRNDGVTVIDTGIPDSASLILEAPASLGRRAEDVREIVLTHSHRRQTGSVAELAQRTGKTLLAHPAHAAVIGGLRTPPAPDVTELERSLAELVETYI